MKKEYQIYQIKDVKCLLVVILSVEMTDYYWQNLKSELANLDSADSEVYFDFLYRNGLRNRFFKSKLHGVKLVDNSLRKCDAPEECVRVADTFFAKHSAWIETSVLSSLQKLFYKHKISDLCY